MQMCREAKAKLLLHIDDLGDDGDWIERLFHSSVIRVDPDSGTTAGAESPRDISLTDLPEPDPDDAAYIFFTSGSTGIPKGVLGRHKGLNHFITWQRDTFSVGPQDRCAQLTNLSFDVVLRDIFLPLTSGAALCLPEEPEGPESGNVLSWIHREGITILHAVPSVAEFWLDSIQPGTVFQSPRIVFFAGEPLRETLIKKWHKVFPALGRIVNLYGPTETTLAKCFYELPSDIMQGVQPIGSTLPGTQALVVSESGRLCGVGEIGEIVIRTPFCTLGYINAPEEQRRCFRKNPFRDDPADIVYYTGDIGRYRPDGLLTIHGRLDFQVKVRGIRVEPDEISVVLENHPLVKSSVVTAQDSNDGDKILVAYIVPSGQAGITVSELRSYLSKYVPVYMIPSFFVFMDSMPLLANGKIDRNALPAPDLERPSDGAPYIAPRSPLEEVLAAIWGDVLGLKEVGVHQNFFEMGGHSLLATQVMSRIGKAFNVEIPLRSLFERPTVAGLVELIECCSRCRKTLSGTAR